MTAAVRKASVMTGNCQCCKRLSESDTFDCTGGGVIDMSGITVEPSLKGTAVFSNIVSQPGQKTLLSCIKDSSKFGRELSSFVEMLRNCFCAAILCNVCQIGRCGH